ncbi:MAG: MFS transporter [Candidatus Omnitrophica bacterium]|nr:MFS transporter [Candidatus Omnitrophota bacterium]
MKKTDFFTFCLTFLTLSFGVTAMAALVPAVAHDFNVSGKEAIKLTWLYMLPYGLFAVIWGPLTRVVKIRNIFAFTVGGFFLSAMLLSMAMSINLTFIFRFLMGCFGSSFIPLALISVAKTVRKEEKSKYIGVFFAISYFSTMLSVFLSGFIYWRFIYFAQACISLVLLCMVIFYMENFDFTNEKSKISYAKTLTNGQAMRFLFIVGCASFLYHAVWQRFGLFLNEEMGMVQTIISVLFTVSTFGAVIFEFAGGLLVARVKSLKVVRYGFFTMCFIFLFILTRNISLMFFIVFVWGGAWALTHVALSSYLTNLPDNVLRDVSSLNSSFRFLFGGLGALFGGVVVNLFGFSVLFFICGAGLFFLGYFCKNLLTQGV